MRLTPKWPVKSTLKFKHFGCSLLCCIFITIRISIIYNNEYQIIAFETVFENTRHNSGEEYFKNTWNTNKCGKSTTILTISKQ